LETTAKALDVSVQGHSFETPLHADGGLAIADPIGWTTTSGEGLMGIFNPTDSNSYAGSNDSGAHGGTLPNMDGVQLAFLTGGGTTVVEQTLSGVVVEDNTIYTATTAVGSRTRGTAWWNGTYEYEFALVAGTTVVSSITGDSVNLDEGTLTDVSTSFTNDGNEQSGESLTIRFTNLSGGNADFDNVRLDATVIPEPATLAVFGLSGLLVLLRRRR